MCLFVIRITYDESNTVLFAFVSPFPRTATDPNEPTQKKGTNVTTTNRGESFIARIGSTENFISYCRRLAMMTTATATRETSLISK